MSLCEGVRHLPVLFSIALQIDYTILLYSSLLSAAYSYHHNHTSQLEYTRRAESLTYQYKRILLKGYTNESCSIRNAITAMSLEPGKAI